VATHELAAVSAAERVVALRDGAVIFDGPATAADAAALVVR
jgi:ABC-type phosphate/phosphonate transport system ATPase subunit